MCIVARDSMRCFLKGFKGYVGYTFKTDFHCAVGYLMYLIINSDFEIKKQQLIFNVLCREVQSTATKILATWKFKSTHAIVCR